MKEDQKYQKFFERQRVKAAAVSFFLQAEVDIMLRKGKYESIRFSLSSRDHGWFITTKVMIEGSSLVAFTACDNLVEGLHYVATGLATDSLDWKEDKY